jgi:hypothetical protein
VQYQEASGFPRKAYEYSVRLADRHGLGDLPAAASDIRLAEILAESSSFFGGF